MANKRITDVDFAESLNNNESIFINQDNAIKQIKVSNFNIAKCGTITIPVSAWGQNGTYGNLFYANISGSAPYVVADPNVPVFASPAELPIENYNMYIASGVRVVEQGAETLGFIAVTKPTIDVVVNYTVLI